MGLLGAFPGQIEASLTTTAPLTSVDILKGDFAKFLWFVFREVLGLPSPTRLQLDIARFLADQENPFRFIQAFRGIGKSFLTCCYVVWRLWKEPNLKVLIVSANETLATENATLIKLIIDAPAGADLWGSLRTPAGARSSTLAFDVGGCVPDKSPSVKVAGITGQITGSRSDILISDDVEVTRNSQTETQREQLAERTSEYVLVAKPGSEIIYLGTPQTEESIYRQLQSKGFVVRVWPARYPLSDKLANYLGTIAPILLEDLNTRPDLGRPVGSSLGGAPTDTRFNEQQLQTQEMALSAAGFMLQMMLDTALTDAEKYPLKTRDIIVTDVDRKIAPLRMAWGSSPDQIIKDLPNVGFDGDRFYRPIYAATDFTEFTGSVMIVDPSGRGKDETAYCVTKFLNGLVYVRRWGGFRDGYSAETLQAIANISAEEEVNLIKCEDTFGDGMFRQLLEPYVRKRRPTTIEGYKRFTQKEGRIIDVLQPALAQHRVVMDAAAVRQDLAHPEPAKRGLYQLTHITRQRGALKHDDRVEVLAEAVLAWAVDLNADGTEAEAAYRRKQEQEWERRLYKGTALELGLRKPGVLSRGTGRRPSPRKMKVRW